MIFRKTENNTGFIRDIFWRVGLIRPDEGIATGMSKTELSRMSQ